jgi:hypothetical protein
MTGFGYVSHGRIQNLGEYRQSRPRRSPDGLFGAKKLLQPTHFGQEKHRIDLRGLLVPQLLDAPVSHIADVLLAPLPAIGGFPIIERLQAVSAQLLTFLGA